MRSRFVSGEHRLLACSIRQLAECTFAYELCLQGRFAASCRERQAGSLRSLELGIDLTMNERSFIF